MLRVLVFSALMDGLAASLSLCCKEATHIMRMQSFASGIQECLSSVIFFCNIHCDVDREMSGEVSANLASERLSHKTVQ